MKKLLPLLLLLLSAPLLGQDKTDSLQVSLEERKNEAGPEEQKVQKERHFYVGGTGALGYADRMFQFSLFPMVGYEFNDRVSIGASVGVSVAAGGDKSGVLGLVEPYVSFTLVDRPVLHFELSPSVGFGFDRSLELFSAGVTPSLGFYVDEHWDCAVSLGMIGVTYQYGEWGPSIGLNGVSTSFSVLYRF